MIGLIDCHLHLQEPPLLEELEGVVHRAREAGVHGFVTNGSSEADWNSVAELARRVDGLVPCFGLHPWYVSGRSPGWLESLERRLLESPSGVGEIGLDGTRPGLEGGDQVEVFRVQLRLSTRLRRPAMVHCVRAWGPLLEVLRAEDSLPPSILFHAFGGSVECLEELVRLGAYVSFAGDTLDPRKERKHAALRAAPGDRLCVETDAPDLLPPPEARRSFLRKPDGREASEPSNLPSVLEGLASLRAESPEALALATRANTRRMLGDICPAGLAGEGC